MKNKFLFFIFYFSLTVTGAARVQSIGDTGLFVIEKISIENNTKTKASVFFENLPFKIGDTLTEPEIHAGIEHLRKLRFFNEVTLLPRAGSEPGKLHLIIKVKERRWPTLRFKSGFSELSGWYLTPVSLNLDNIFGRGNFTDLNMTIGDRVFSLNFNYINPNIFDSDLDFHFNYWLRNTQFINYIESQKFSQYVPQAGFFLGLQGRNSIFKRFLFGWDFYVTTPDSFFTYPDSKEKYYELPEKIARYSFETNETSAFSIYYGFDNRDQAGYPCRGWWIGAWFSQARVKIDGEKQFTRLIFDIRKYQHLSNKFVLAARFKIGGISAGAPFYEKFYLGGPNSLRGYADRSLSPVGGGERMLQGGLELRFPITTKNFPKHFLTGTIFFDTGANFYESEKLVSDKMNSSYGFGFRFKLPFVNIVRIDFAYPMNGDKGLVQFSLGHTF